MNLVKEFIKLCTGKGSNETAIRDQWGSFTYQNLLEYSYLIAANLKKQGVKKGDFVTIELKRCIQYAASIFAIWLINAVAVPLSDSYPIDRVNYIRNDCNFKIAINDEFLNNLDEKLKFVPQIDIKLDDYALVVYTSGSTGNPKGVVHSHRSALNAINKNRKTKDATKFFGITAQFTFIVGITYIVAGLMLRKDLYIVPDDICKDAFKLAQFYADNDIKGAFIPPRLINFFLEKNKSLTYISVGSERVSNIYSDKVAIFNGYGSTETFGGILNFKIDKPYENTPIGKPIMPNEFVYILDDDNNEVEEGEICISGIFATGYLNLPEETKRSFIKNPFYNKNGDKNKFMFRTKDIGRKDKDGNVIFVERKDWMIKINGQRVEPLEVENVIKKIPSITAAAIKDFTSDQNVTYLVAYYVSGGKVKPEEVKEYVKTRVTSYMVPTYFMELPFLPVNLNGKLDRKNLPKPEVTDYKTEYESPVGEIEIELSEAIEEILKCGKIGRNDDFFHIGGDSVKSLELIQICEDLPLTSEIIYECKTPKLIAEKIINDVGENPYIKEVKSSYPLTPSQLGIYFPCLNNPNTTKYNNPFILDLDNEIDINKLIESVEASLNNHDAYKCHIDTINGVPSMVPYNNKIKINIVETNSIENELKDFVKPFDLSNDQLVRTTLYKEKDRMVLAFDFHHIVFDGTSLAVILKEISTYYLKGKILKEKTSIFDLSNYEEKLIETEEYQKSKEYYENIFESNEISNDFPIDYEDKNLFTADTILLKDSIADKVDISSLLRKYQITENTLFLGAFMYTLSRFNGNDKSLTCVAENGRHNAYTSNTAGMLVKTIALPLELSNFNSIEQLLQNVQNSLKESIKNDIYPFSQLANKYGFNNDFQFVYQSDQFVSLKINDKQYPIQGIVNKDAISKISLSVFKDEDGYRFNFSYRSDLFYRSVIESFAKTYINVVKEFLNKTNINDIELCDVNAIAELNSFSQTLPGYEFKDIVTKFYENLNINPDKIFVNYHDKNYTYKEANIISNKIANYINNLKISRNCVVSVLIPRCEWMALATLGINKSGAAYQPLDPTYPKERLTFMVKDAGAKLLITTKDLEPLIEGYKGKVLYIDDIKNLENENDVHPNIESDNLFIMLYTSGTTGTPKGVMLTYGNISAFEYNLLSVYSLDEESRISCFASYGFDACMFDLSSNIYANTSLFIIDEETRLNIPELDEFLIKNKITHSFMTTQVARQFYLYTKSPYLKVLCAGGEKLVPVYRDDTQIKLFNGYGPTECCIFCSGYYVDKLMYRVPIGKLNYNLKGYIIDKNFKRLPLGVPGELLVSGSQVAKGYLNRPEKTAESFIKNPFTKDKEYQKMYRTGDIVRFIHDGLLDFIGRNDGQVKVRGFRIELTEVESIIRDFKGINDATVAAFENPDGTKYLAAYIVSDTQIDIDQLRNFILDHKPPYMVPESIMQIDKIPLNQNSKVNKRALPQPIKSATKKSKNPAVHEDNIIVTKLRAIIKDIIGNDDFGYDDNIFDYGMTSISVVKLSIKLSEEFNVNADTKTLLNDCTLKNIENIILNKLLNSEVSEIKQKKTLMANYPLSKTQIGIYTEYLRNKDATNYNIPIELTFNKIKDNKITLEILKESLNKVLNAHNSLKATFESDEKGNFVMVPHSENEMNLTIKTGTPDEYQKFRKDFVKPHDLSKQCYEFAIFDDSENIYLLIDIHHIMFDGFSQNLFISELYKAINGEKLTEENYTIFDIAADEQAALLTEKYQIAKDYYANLLNGVDGSTKLERNNFENRQIPKILNLKNNDLDMQALLKYCKNNNITFNAFFLSIMAFTLSEFTYQENVCFTTVYNGRNSIEASKLIGMTVKTLPVSLNFSSNKKIKDLTIEMKNQILSSMNNDLYSFAEINKEFDVDMDVLFVYQGEIDNNQNNNIKFLSLNGLKAPLVLEIRNDDKSFYIRAEYDNGKYTDDFINQYISTFMYVAQQFLTKEFTFDIKLVNEKEEKIIHQLNQNEEDYDLSTPIHQFKNIVKKYPNNAALTYLDKHFTYKELDESSDIIANYLINKGIGREDIVGILIPRNEYTVIATLGVLKSGAAYQPLDSSYPKERLNFMLQDSEAKLLITTPDLKEIVDEYKGNVLYLEEIDKLEKPLKEIKIPAEPQDKFVLLYTSGTTGLPKGVILENKSLSAELNYVRKIAGFDSKTKATAYASFGFDAFIQDSLATLTSGGELFVIPEDLRLNLPKLDEYIIENKITYVFMTTQVCRQYLQNTKSPYIKTINMGGEKLVPFDPTPYKFNCINAYGPTECAIATNYFIFKKLYHRVPIGKANINTKEYIVDKQNRMLPIGALGELTISGPQVARGYLNRPEKTASVFIENKFIKQKGYEKLYKTGDLVRMLPDGNVDIIGRNDGQVKVRGFRVELTEVQEIIQRFPEIKNATVAAFDDPAGGKFIAAYIVSDQKIDINALNEFIGSEKPPYMIPKITMQIDAIPLNVNNKVDKRKLPKPDISLLQNEYVEPANEIEKEFTELFKEILGLNKVGATDDFFALGGTSISAAQIVSYAFTKGYDIVYKNVFENSTPRKLSNFIKSQNYENTVEENPAEPQHFTKNPAEPAFSHNTIEDINEINITPIGNVLLFGSTGFLGIHILKELLDNKNNKIYCVVRENDLNTPENRLKTLLEYYFENSYDSLFNNRLFVIKGDLLSPNLDELTKDAKFDCIINCAATVKHFSNDDSIQKTNAGGVANLIELALKRKVKLFHVSTLSVAGESVNDSIPNDFLFKENMLSIGQSIDNKYIKSKFDAESQIAEAITNKGLIAKIFRVGNLMSRQSDGEFQINFYSNNFMNTIKAFQVLHAIPYDMLTHHIEFSQIDLVAKAILTLAEVNDKFTVFHANNIHTIQMNNVIEEMNKNGLEINRVDALKFMDILNNALINSKNNIQSLNSLLAYRANRKEKRKSIATNNSFTLEMLYRLGFVWPLPDNDYLSKLIDYLVSVEFFK